MPPLSTGAIVVFALVAVALLLFVTEWLPPDMTAIGVLVALVVLEPYTQVPARAAIEGFASPAVLTILAMYILSAGVERAGVVDWLGGKLATLTGGDEGRLLAAIVGTTGVSAGFVNNTPIVAVFIPLVTGLSDRYGISPSRLLLPLSFAAMLGGTLTLIGTATNLLASDLSAELLGEPFSMFTLTPVGVVVLVVGVAYLLTVGRTLVPERIHPAADFTEEFDMDRYLAQLRIRDDSPLIGLTVTEALDRTVTEELVTAAAETVAGEPLTEDVAPDDIAAVGTLLDVDVLQIDRDGESFFASATDRTLEADDVLTVRGNRQSVNRFAETLGLRQLARESVTEELLAESGHLGVLVEAVVDQESRLRGRTLADVQLRARFDATVLAVRRGDDLIRDGLGDVTFSAGDTLLLQTPVDEISHLEEEGYLVLTEGPPELFDVIHDDETPSLDPSALVPLAILTGVIAVAALDLLPIYIAALGGVVTMVATGTLSASKAYDAVSWNVVFLLAGLLPLGLAMQETGGAAFLGGLLSTAGEMLPPLALLALFYLLTAVLASVITPVATVVLMIPIAVATAQDVGVAGLPFLLIVTFAVATAFLTPIGYQTNLMVYGPGGYRFTDYARVGLPLQLLLCAVTTLAVAFVWPL